MDVFISSVITGFEPFRAAAAEAIESLGYRVLRAENLGASTASPQIACLSLVRAADLVVILLGERYGSQQASGLSATHEEYREAAREKQVLAFVQDGVSFEPAQQAFVAEVQEWEGGSYTSSFRTPDELRSVVTRAVHEHILATEARPLDGDDLVARARSLLPADDRSFGQSPRLILGIAAGPTRYVLRPAELVGGELRDTVLSQAVIGPLAVLPLESGVDTAVTNHDISFQSERSGAAITITDQGSLLIVQSAVAQSPSSMSMPAVIEEFVLATLERAFRLAGAILDTIDPVNRLTHVAPVVSMTGAAFTPWRTAAEQAATPNSYTLGASPDTARTSHNLTPPVRRRAELTQRSSDLAADALILLRNSYRP